MLYFFVDMVSEVDQRHGTDWSRSVAGSYLQAPKSSVGTMKNKQIEKHEFNISTTQIRP